MNNNQCILVEFVNEQNCIQTGFLSWLNIKTNAQQVKTLIAEKKEVVINWPNIDISEASSMKTKLKKFKAIFKKEVVKILAYGEWTEIREKQLNLEKFGKETLNRKDRREFKKKYESDGDEESEFIEKKKKPNTRARGKTNTKTSEDLMNKIQTTQKNQPKVNYASSDDTGNLTDENITAGPSKTINKVYNSEKTDDHGNDFQNIEAEYDKLKEKFCKLEDKYTDLLINGCVDCNDYKKQIKLLNQEIESYKERLLFHQSLFDSIEKDCDEVRAMTNEVKEKIKTYKLTIPEDNNLEFSKNIANNVLENKNLSLLSKENVVKQPILKEKEGAPSTSQVHMDNSTTKPDDINDENFSNTSKNDSSKESDDTKADLKYVIPDEIKKKCVKRSASTYAGDLMLYVFSTEELATHSIRGTQSNANKHLNLPIKPALDAAKLKAVKNAVIAKFGSFPEQKKLMNSAIRSKLQEASKSYKENNK